MIMTGDLVALFEDKSWAGRLDAGDAERILGRETSDGGGAIDPVGREGQKVGLMPAPAPLSEPAMERATGRSVRVAGMVVGAWTQV